MHVEILGICPKPLSNSKRFPEYSEKKSTCLHWNYVEDHGLSNENFMQFSGVLQRRRWTLSVDENPIKILGNSTSPRK